MPDAPGAKANSKAAKARQNPEVGLWTSTLHPAGRSYGNPDPEFYPQMSVTKTLAPNHPQKNIEGRWIHAKYMISYEFISTMKLIIWNQPLEPVLMELLCFSWGTLTTLTTLTGSCGQHDRSDGSEHSRDSKRSPRQCLPVRWAAPWTFTQTSLKIIENILKQFENIGMSKSAEGSPMKILTPRPMDSLFRCDRIGIETIGFWDWTWGHAHFAIICFPSASFQEWTAWDASILIFSSDITQ